jgi:hypothetical protein
VKRVRKLRQGGLEGFKCGTCGAFHSFGSYVIAQTTMGHSLTHTCKCRAKHEVTPEREVYLEKAGRKPRRATA